MQKYMKSTFTCIIVSFLILNTNAAIKLKANDKIKHIVLLELENRSFDHMLGWMTQGGDFGDDRVDGLQVGKNCNPLNYSDPAGPQICANQDARNNALYSPDHSYSSTTARIFGCTFDTTNNASSVSPCENHQSLVGDPNMQGFASEAIREQQVGGTEFNMFPSDKVPIISSLAKEFANFDRYFSGYPGSTWPNRMFLLSGTTGGCTDTSCKIPLGGYPQKTVFRQIDEAQLGLDWSIYYADVVNEQLLFRDLVDPATWGHFHNMDQFYSDAANGDLANFNFISVRWTALYNESAKDFGLINTQHPVASVLEGERLIKNVYEAIRNGKGWNDTLLIITYDEHGGFYDHVAPPQEGVPSPDGIQNDYGFASDRLGIRVPFICVSPWISKNQLVHFAPDAQKPFNNSEFEHSSVPATIQKMFGIQGDSLTNRTAWAATFEHVLDLDEPRTDCPETLVNLPDPSQAVIDLQTKFTLGCKQGSQKGCTFQESNQPKYNLNN